MDDLVSERYRRLADDFAARIASVPAGCWTNPSPCAGWTAQDVVQHVIDSHDTFLGLIGRALPPGTPDAADDAEGAFDIARMFVQAGLDNPKVAATRYAGVLGSTTFAQGVDTFLCFDLNVHGWDIARAVGLSERIDPAEVRRLHQEAEGFGQHMRSADWFGPAVTPPEGADDQARLLAFLGRDPS